MEYHALDVAGASAATGRCEVTSTLARNVLFVCALVWVCCSMLLATAVGERYGWSRAQVAVAAVGGAALVVGWSAVWLLSRLCGAAPRAPRATEAPRDAELAISTAEEVLPAPQSGITLLPKDEK